MSDAARRGGEDGPITPDAFKRTVCKRAPRHFHVELLPPEKHSSNSHSYGFRVFPLKDDDASISARSTSSHGSVASFNEYDVWRKWEDCLWFQDSLENAYSRLARAKRNRLAAGKGIKKNGVYIHSDQAASWESLPFGPDPDAIARDIHEYIPKLSKKATIFRASQETLNQRYEELLTMMGVLLSDDLPTLIKDIKATSAFTDFFGVWRRDVDLARKAASPKKSTSAEPRQSISDSIRFTLPGSPASQSLKLPSLNKGKSRERSEVPIRVPASSDSSSEDFTDSLRPSRMMNRGHEVPSGRSRASSSDSRSSASLPSTPIAMSPLTSRVPLAASQEMPLRFGHNPLSGERHPYSLQSLPEDCEFAPSLNSSLHELSPRKRSGSTASSVNRNARVYVPSPSSSVEFNEPPSELPPRSLTRYSRASLQSRYSSGDLRATAYLDELDVDYCLPSATPVPRGHPRASVCSMASVVTNTSVDAVIPRNDRPLLRNNRPRPDSLAEEPEYGPWSENESSPDDLLDAYFCEDVVTSDTSIAQDYPETPMTCRFGDRLSIVAPSSSSRYFDRRSSFSSQSTSTSSLSSSNPGVLSIKAMHEEEIVVLRLPSYIGFEDLRRKIYNKFSQVERPTISESFAIAVVEQVPPTSLQGHPKPKGGGLRFISSQAKWADVVATQYSNKMVLRIIGSRE